MLAIVVLIFNLYCTVALMDDRFKVTFCGGIWTFLERGHVNILGEERHITLVQPQ